MISFIRQALRRSAPSEAAVDAPSPTRLAGAIPAKAGSAEPRPGPQPSATPESAPRLPASVAGLSRPLRLAVINVKGGSGKSTLATNIAAHYANAGETVALIDHDPIAISISWARQRPEDVPVVHAVDASSNARRGHSFNWRTRLPATATLLVADTPGGMDRLQMREMLDWADLVVVPVLPSSIDIRAASRFMGELLRHPGFRNHRQRVAVVANRVTQWTGMHYKLDRFLNTLRIPFLTTITETEGYAKAYEQSLGLCELSEDVTASLQEWQALYDWIAREGINRRAVASNPAPASPAASAAECGAPPQGRALAALPGIAR